MRRWVEFWARSAVNGLRWGKSALDRGLWVAAALAFLFGVAFVLAPLHHAASTRKHPFHYHFPTLRFCISIGAFWLLALGHGAFVTWKKDTDSLSLELTTVETERDALLAEKAAPKRLPDAHVAEMKEMIRSARNEVKAEVQIFYGAGSLSEAVLYQDAIRRHYPALAHQLEDWDRTREKRDFADEDLILKAKQEVEALLPLGITRGSDQHLLKAISDARPLRPEDWSEHTDGPFRYWRGQGVVELPLDALPAAEATAKAAMQWLEVGKRTMADAQLRIASYRLSDPLAKAEKQHLINDTRFCEMCPEEFRKSAADVTLS